MTDLIPVFPEIAAKALINADWYKTLYEKSISDPVGFWAEQAKTLHWFKPPQKITSGSFKGDIHTNDLRIKWFEDGRLNVAHNCIDRHMPQRTNQTAIIWESDDPKDSKSITYGELRREVNRFANVLKAQGIKKGDTVTIYMPMILETAYAMLACARIGAVHSVVFGGFSPTSLRERIIDCGSALVITADEGLRGGRTIPLKANVDEALKGCPTVSNVLIVRRTGNPIEWKRHRDHWYHEEAEKVTDECPSVEMNAEDPFFILYTSGSTGKPKGVLHTTGGYLLHASLSHRYVFDLRADDVYWCTADIGWITGHSYVLYGPLANGTTTVMFESTPHYPDHSRFWQVIDKHKINIFYTAPTAIRALMREGDDFVKRTNRKSLRILASVGEPLNPEAWDWYFKIVGDSHCPVIDTWWQTETGGHMITPLPGATPLKSGSVTLPFFGIKPVIVDQQGKILEGACEGNLCIAESWPGMLRTLWGNHDRFRQGYFTLYPGMYFTGDGARRDEDGYYWVTGRVDDVLNVAGHRLSTAEIESALVAHKNVAEAAVVGCPHAVKGQGVYIYVTLNTGVEPTEELRKELFMWVRKRIGPIATPDFIQWAPGLPKTRSGKIMRRILRKIAEGDVSNLGDTSTLADPGVVDELVKNRQS
jgi:acetyl-CoA synthetase